jgi:hypothetical protein
VVLIIILILNLSDRTILPLEIMFPAKAQS